MSLDYLTYVRDESDRFAAVLRDADPGARVPSCPDWSADDLLWHLAEVHWQWATVVGRRVTDAAQLGPLGESKPARPDDRDELFALYDRVTGELVEALAGADDDEPVWTWSSEQNVGFVRRFQAHEALIHRLDAELAAGVTPSPLPTDLAEDGVDVVLRYGKTWRPEAADWRLSNDVGRVLATDTGREWTVQLGSWTGEDGAEHDALEVLDGGTISAAFTANASAADLDAWFWQRPGGTVTVTGAAAPRFTALVKEGMP